MADFILFFASIDTGFFVEHIKNAFCYIVENFEEFLLISGRENALRVTSVVNISCMQKFACKIPTFPTKTGELAFQCAIGEILFQNKMP